MVEQLLHASRARRTESARAVVAMGACSHRHGTQVVLSSHSMYAYRGVRFCAVCGGYGAYRTTLLAAKCERGTGNAARAAVIRKMFAKQLPINIKDWPAIFQPVALDDSQISNEDKLTTGF